MLFTAKPTQFPTWHTMCYVLLLYGGSTQLYGSNTQNGGWK